MSRNVREERVAIDVACVSKAGSVFLLVGDFWWEVDVCVVKVFGTEVMEPSVVIIVGEILRLPGLGEVVFLVSSSTVLIGMPSSP